MGSENVGRLYDIIVVGKFWRGSRILMAIATIIMSGSLAYWLYLLIYRIDQESEYFDPLSGPIILILIIVGLIWMAALGIEQYIISRDGILRRNPVAGDLFIKWQDFASVSIAASGKQADEWRFKFKFADQTVEFNAGGKDSWYIAENISKNIPRDRWINPVFVESCIEIAQKKQKY